MEVIILLLVFGLIAVRMSMKISARAKDTTKVDSETESLWNFVFEEEDHKTDVELENVKEVKKNVGTEKRKVESVVFRNKEVQEKRKDEKSEQKDKSFSLKEAVIYSTILDRPYK